VFLTCGSRRPEHGLARRDPPGHDLARKRTYGPTTGRGDQFTQTRPPRLPRTTVDPTGLSVPPGVNHADNGPARFPHDTDHPHRSSIREQQAALIALPDEGAQTRQSANAPKRHRQSISAYESGTPRNTARWYSTPSSRRTRLVMAATLQRFFHLLKANEHGWSVTPEMLSARSTRPIPVL